MIKAAPRTTNLAGGVFFTEPFSQSIKTSAETITAPPG